MSTEGNDMKRKAGSANYQKKRQRSAYGRQRDRKKPNRKEFVSHPPLSQKEEKGWR